MIHLEAIYAVAVFPSNLAQSLNSCRDAIRRHLGVVKMRVRTGIIRKVRIESRMKDATVTILHSHSAAESEPSKCNVASEAR